MAPFVAVPGVYMTPYGTPNGSLCGSTWGLSGSLWGSPRLPLWQYLNLSGSLWAPQWLPLWQYLGCRAGPKGFEHHIDDALRCQHIATNHRRLRGRAEDGTFRKEHPHRGQAALWVINYFIRGVVH